MKPLLIAFTLWIPVIKIGCTQEKPDPKPPAIGTAYSVAQPKRIAPIREKTYDFGHVIDVIDDGPGKPGVIEIDDTQWKKKATGKHEFGKGIEIIEDVTPGMILDDSPRPQAGLTDSRPTIRWDPTTFCFIAALAAWGPLWMIVGLRMGARRA